MEKRKHLLKQKNNELKLVKPIMKFNAGLLRFEIDVKKTKKRLKWAKKKKT